MNQKEESTYEERIKRYSLAELYGVKSRIDKESFSERYELVLNEIEQREKENGMYKKNTINSKLDDSYELGPFGFLFYSIVTILIGLTVSIFSFYYWAEYGYPRGIESPNSILALFGLFGLGVFAFGLFGIRVSWNKFHGKKL